MEFRRAVKTPLDLALYRKALYKDILPETKLATLREPLREARLFFLTEDMADVVFATSKDSNIRLSDVVDYIPTKSGIVCLNAEFLDTGFDSVTGKQNPPVRYMGIFWSLQDNGDLLSAPFYDIELVVGNKHYTREERKNAKKEYGDAPYPYIAEIETGRNIYKDGTDSNGFWESDLFAFFAMLGTRVANNNVVPVQGQQTKKGAKPFKDIVNIVNIGNIKHVTTDEHKGGRLTVRFVVGGHFRNHWFAKEGVHKRIFVEPFVKGPAGAPMKQSRPVYKF